LILVSAITSLAGKVFTDNMAYQMSVIVSDRWEQAPADMTKEEYLKYIVDSFQMSSVDAEQEDITFDEEKLNLYFETTHKSNIMMFLPNLIQYNIWMKESSQNPAYSNYFADKMVTNDSPFLEKLVSLVSNESSVPVFQSDYSSMLSLEPSDTVTTDSSNTPNDTMDNSPGNLDKPSEIGRITVRLNPNYLLYFYAFILFLSFIILGINSLLIKIITMALSKIITSPVESVATQMVSLAEGDIETSMNTVINVKNPVLEVQQLMDSTNSIMSKMSEYAETMEAQNEELEAQTDELEAQNLALEDRSHSLSSINNAYLSRTLKLQNLLDNVGQGFLTFGADLLINPEYSLECEEMISCQIEGSINGHSIIETLFSNFSDQEFVSTLLEKVFSANFEQKDLYLSLLPEEIESNCRILHLEYKVVYDENGVDQLLLIMTDITKTRSLEKQMDEERNILKMIVKVLLNRSEFLTIIEDYKIFASSNFTQLATNGYEETLRNIHTHKGIFSQYYMDSTTRYLNDLEIALYEDNDPMVLSDLHYEELVAALEYDLSIIESYVGNEFLYDDTSYTIKDEKISDIENKIKNLLSSTEYNKIMPIIQSIRHKSVKSLLRTYPDYTIKLSERLNKSVKSFDIEGDEVYIDPTVYKKVFKTLVHIFRNSVDHGIETSDRRFESGKLQAASIECQVEALPDGFKIIISDDGCGINAAHILKNAISKGIVASDDHLTTDEIHNLIFADGITSRDSVTTLSGRGVGLAAVRYAVEELNGSIEVTATENVGTTFTITLPYITDSNIISFTPENLLQHITVATERCLESINIKIDNTRLQKSNRITLQRVSALISIKGSIEAILIISTNKPMGVKLAKAFMLEDIEDKDILNYIEDVLGEITNTILGNVLGLLDEEGVYLSIGIPAVISNKDAYIKYTESQIVSLVYENGPDSLSLNLLVIDNGEGYNYNQ
nr:ATP-binding protein [Vallitaleaceae bacterium]